MYPLPPLIRTPEGLCYWLCALPDCDSVFLSVGRGVPKLQHGVKEVYRPFYVKRKKLAQAEAYV